MPRLNHTFRRFKAGHDLATICPVFVCFRRIMTKNVKKWEELADKVVR